MTTAVRDNPEKSRYEVFDPELAGFSEYQLGKSVIAFTHTEIDEAFGGRGLAKVLVTEALADVRERGMWVRPFCPYVRGVIEKNQADYLDLVRPEDRAQFNLPEAE